MKQITVRFRWVAMAACRAFVSLAASKESEQHVIG